MATNEDCEKRGKVRLDRQQDLFFKIASPFMRKDTERYLKGYGKELATNRFHSLRRWGARDATGMEVVARRLQGM